MSSLTAVLCITLKVGQQRDTIVFQKEVSSAMRWLS